MQVEEWGQGWRGCTGGGEGGGRAGRQFNKKNSISLECDQKQRGGGGGGGGEWQKCQSVINFHFTGR